MAHSKIQTLPLVHEATTDIIPHIADGASAGAPAGTVTSVAQTVPVEFTISGSPVTTSGTLAIGKATEVANTVWAGPTSGADAQPTFRPLTAADIPAGTGNSWLWGSGLDGNVHFDGTNTFSFAVKTGNVYVLSRNVHATDCTIDAGVTVNIFDWTTPGVGGGQQIYCTGTFTCNGHYSGDGQSNNVNLDQGGTGTPSGVNGTYFYGANGGSGNGGANGNAGGNRTDGFGGDGAAGGTSSDGHTGGAKGTATYTDAPQIGGYYQLYTAYAFQSGVIRGQAAIYRQFGGGAGGGAGGGVTTGNHKGAGGGAGGSPIGIFAKFIAGTGIISSDGSPGNVPPSSTNAGGGGGGGGGLVLLITTTVSIPCTVRANGGAGGLSGGAGGNGSAGAAGKVISILVN